MHPPYLLSSREHEVARDTDWLYTKQRIIEKVYLLFGSLSEAYKPLAATPGFDQRVISIPPKIYKGEQYRRLPYVMLDFPRYFSGRDACAIRSLFWWGHHFSIHLVLGGEYRQRYARGIARRTDPAASVDWYLSLTDDPWHHHFEEGNYVHASLLPNSFWEDEANYLKIGRYLPLERWDQAFEFYQNAFSELIDLIK